MISQDPATLLALILVTVYAIKYATSRVPPGGGGVEEICKKNKNISRSWRRFLVLTVQEMMERKNNNNNEADRRQRLKELVVYFLVKMFK